MESIKSWRHTMWHKNSMVQHQQNYCGIAFFGATRRTISIVGKQSFMCVCNYPIVYSAQFFMLNNPKRILRTVLRYVCLLDYLYSYIQTYFISLLMVCSGIVFQNIFAYVTLILTPSTHCRLVRGANSVLRLPIK